MGNLYLIIAAGGKSERFGKDKLFIKLFGKTILEWSILNFKGIKFKRKAIVLNKERVNDEKIKKKFKDFLIVEGGEKRAISVYNGFKEIAPEENSILIIHDGARPFVPASLIKNLLKEIKKENGVVPVLKIRDSLKKIKKNYIKETIEREEIYAVQTPQIFKANFLYNAYEFEKKIWENFTDESQLLELLKIPVKVIEGSALNLKITYKEDLEILKKIIRNHKFCKYY